MSTVQSQADPSLIPDCPRPNTRLTPSACVVQWTRWRNASASSRKIAGAQACPPNCRYGGLTADEIQAQISDPTITPSPPPKTEPRAHPKKNAPTATPAKDRSEPDPKDVGRRLREARIAAGYKSQAVATAALGLGAGTLGRHECGGGLPSPRVMKVYVERFGVTEDWLLTGRGRGPDEAGPGRLSPEQAEKARVHIKALADRRQHPEKYTQIDRAELTRLQTIESAAWRWVRAKFGFHLGQVRQSELDAAEYELAGLICPELVSEGPKDEAAV